MIKLDVPDRPIGNNPDCEHPNASRTHLYGHGRNAVYAWGCPDCLAHETEFYEDDDG